MLTASGSPSKAPAQSVPCLNKAVSETKGELKRATNASDIPEELDREKNSLNSSPNHASNAATSTQSLPSIPKTSDSAAGFIPGMASSDFVQQFLSEEFSSEHGRGEYKVKS